MTASTLTIRLREDHDHHTIQAAKAATRETTASKALMRAAHLYPEAKARADRYLDRLQATQTELETLKTALRRWNEAHDLETARRRELESLAAR